ITGLWTTPVGETYSFEGKHYRVTNSPALPKPVAGKPPVLVGGFGPKRTPRLAARFADEFNVPFFPVSDCADAFDKVREACATAGRRDVPVMSAAQVVCCGRDDDEVARRAAAIGREVDELRANGLAGSPAELVDKIGAFAAAGCQRVYLQVLDLADL